jgi:hypothetical protein
MAMKEKATWRDLALGAARELELRRAGCATSRPAAAPRSSSCTGCSGTPTSGARSGPAVARVPLRRARPAARLAHAADATCCRPDPARTRNLIADASRGLDSRR